MAAKVEASIKTNNVVDDVRDAVQELAGLIRTVEGYNPAHEAVPRPVGPESSKRVAPPWSNRIHR